MDSQAGRIVVGYDGAAPSAAAVDWSATEAERRGLPLTVFYALDCLNMIPGTMGLALVADLDESAGLEIALEGVERAKKSAVLADVKAATALSSAAASLIESSRESALLVVGTRGHGNAAGTVLGSVAFAVSAHASCPVVVVRGDSARHPGPERPVLVGADGSPDSDAAVRFAADIAAGSGAPLVVVTAYNSTGPMVWGPPPAYAVESHGRSDFSSVAQEAAARVTASSGRIAEQAHPGLEVRQQVGDGVITHVLTNAAAGAGLLVVGSRGHGGFAGLRLGSVSHNMIHLAPCPTAIVRA